MSAFSGFLSYCRQNFSFSYGSVYGRACVLMQVFSPTGRRTRVGALCEGDCGSLGPLYPDESWTRSTKWPVSYRRARVLSSRCHRPSLPSCLPLCCFHELYKAGHWYYRPRAATGLHLFSCDPVTSGRATFPCPPCAKPHGVLSRTSVLQAPGVQCYLLS